MLCYEFRGGESQGRYRVRSYSAIPSASINCRCRRDHSRSVPMHSSKKLRYEEMIDLPLDRLLAIGEAQLDKDYKDFVATARRINAGASPAEVMRSLSDQHPTESQLLGFREGDARRTSASSSSTRKSSPFPSDVRPTILETPPYARSGTFASMDTPGAYENVAKEAFYYVTPPEKDWTRAHKEEHLRLFNKPGHGHHHDSRGVSRALHAVPVREAVSHQDSQSAIAHSNAEGWAHYAEQMMLEEGIRRRRPEGSAGATLRGSAARLPLHRRNPTPHAK